MNGFSPEEHLRLRSESTNQPAPSLDIGANRAVRKYGSAEMAKRVVWMVLQPLFRLSPRPCFRWRASLLRLLGARVGEHVHIHNSATIYFPWKLAVGDWSAIGEQVYIYNLGQVTIGRSATISHRAHVCAGTHDYTRRDMPLLRPPISIGDQSWICAEAFVGPGVRIGEGAVVAARAVVVKDVEPWMIVAGNPARPRKRRELRTE
jgi:putative colanic acid biosynthesis acetyltransferase WcaF